MLQVFGNYLPTSHLLRRQERIAKGRKNHSLIKSTVRSEVYAYLRSLDNLVSGDIQRLLIVNPILLDLIPNSDS